MRLSIEHNGTHYYEGEIVFIEAWNKGVRSLYVGRIVLIDGEGLVIDCSDKYKAKKKAIEYDELISIKKV